MKKVKVIKSIILIAAIMLGTLSVGDVNSVNAETASPTDASPTNAKWLSNEVESDDDYEWLDDYEYKKDGDSIILIKYIGKAKDVVINGEEHDYIIIITDESSELFAGADVDSVTFSQVEFLSSYSSFGMFKNSSVKRVEFAACDMHSESLAGMFEGCSELKEVSIIRVPAYGHTRDLSGMFKGCGKLEIFSVEDKFLSFVDNTSEMFSGCTSLESIGFSVIGSEDASKMFFKCTSLKSIGLSIPKARNINNMFEGCTSLTDVYINGQDNRIEKMQSLFEGCSNLKNVQLTRFGFSKNIDPIDMMDVFGGCDNIQSLKIDTASPDGGINLNGMYVNSAGEWIDTINISSVQELKPVDKSFVGCVRHNNEWYYAKDGHFTDWTGTFCVDLNGSRAWRVLNFGKVLTDYKGFAQVGSSVMYFENGLINKSANGTYYGEVDGKKSWYVVKSGKVDKTYTGFAKVGNSVMYYNNGVIDKTFTGTKNANVDGVKQWYYVKNGKINKDYTGFAQVGSSIMYFINGSIDKQFTGLVSGSINGVKGTYYVQNGKYKSDFNGTKSFVIKNGKLVEVK